MQYHSFDACSAPSKVCGRCTICATCDPSLSERAFLETRARGTQRRCHNHHNSPPFARRSEVISTGFSLSASRGRSRALNVTKNNVPCEAGSCSGNAIDVSVSHSKTSRGYGHPRVVGWLRPQEVQAKFRFPEVRVALIAGCRSVRQCHEGQHARLT